MLTVELNYKILIIKTISAQVRNTQHTGSHGNNISVSKRIYIQCPKNDKH